MQKLKLIIYYLIIQYLPHSRLTSVGNKIRMWYVSKVLGIMPLDNNSKFETNIYISDAKNIKIGSYCRINENVFLQGKISIGNFVMIAPNVSIYTKTHIYDNTDVPMVKSGETETQQVSIGDDVWVGLNSTILPGISIGEGSIIAAHSLVNKDVEPYSIVGGVPAKLIKKRV